MHSPTTSTRDESHNAIELVVRLQLNAHDIEQLAQRVAEAVLAALSRGSPDRARWVVAGHHPVDGVCTRSVSSWQTAVPDSTLPITRNHRPPASHDYDAELVSCRVVAGLLGVSQRQVCKLAACGRMPRPIKLGRSTRWRLHELRTWIASGCASPKQA
jgi:predicted DNA-binding transcriptional regulator AlpA